MVKIDFVSDVSCPFCAIGLKSLETALSRVPNAKAELHFQPFELNPTMDKAGEEINDHLARKYGGSPAQHAGTREHVRQRGQAVGVTFDMSAGFRIYNTFNAHRLLHWAGLQHPDGLSLQKSLKVALFQAYFTDKKDPSAENVLLEAAATAGLDVNEARQVLESDKYTADVRAAEAKWQRQNIHSVPTIIFNDTEVISGGQSPETFERILRRYA